MAEASVAKAMVSTSGCGTTDQRTRLIKAYLPPFKRLHKLLSTFGPKYSEWVHPITDRVHADFHLAVASMVVLMMTHAPGHMFVTDLRHEAPLPA